MRGGLGFATVRERESRTLPDLIDMTDLLSRFSVARASRARRPRTHGETGNALVEFAIVLPLLLFLTLGIMRAGILFNNWVMLTDSVRAGARVLAISRAPGVNACTLATTALRNAAPTLNPANLTIASTFPGSASTCTNLIEGADARITASYPCDLNIMGINFTPNGCTLNASTTERIE